MKKKIKIRFTRYISGFSIAMCMALGAMSGTALAQDTGDDAQNTATEHVLCEENNWDISNELIMPGETFYTKPKYVYYPEGALSSSIYIYYEHAGLTLNDPDIADAEDARWETDWLVRSTADISQIVPYKNNSYNLIKIAYDRGDLASVDNEQSRESLQEALKGENQVNAGYKNNTNLPIVLQQVRGTSTKSEGQIRGGEYGLDVLAYAFSTQNWGTVIRFYEPYYMLSYELEGVEGDFTDEEKKVLPDRYYIQNERQEIILPKLVRPGHHFIEWRGGMIGYSDVTVKDDGTHVSFDWKNNLNEAGSNGIGDQTLSTCFEEGFTVTFNPNGGKLKDEDSAIREIDTTDDEVNQFFDIGECVPVREGYKFAGWCTMPAADEDSLIKNTGDSEWIEDWLEECINGQHTDRYDIVLYAKWEKNDICTNGHKPHENITKATMKNDGKIVTQCTVCKETLSTEIIPKVSDISLSDVSYTYNGKVRKPTVTVKDRNGKTISKAYYNISYAKGRKNVGSYDITVKFRGNYSGTVKRSFIIKPKSTVIYKLTAGKKKLTVKWKKQSVQTAGCQIQYAVSSGFKGAKIVNVSNKITEKTISGLKTGKKYYVRIRTYNNVKVNGKTTKIYSSWSSASWVKVK